MVARDHIAVQMRSHHHLVALDLLAGQRLGIRPVVGVEPECRRFRLEADDMEQLSQLHALPHHALHTPPGYALKVVSPMGLRLLLEVVPRKCAWTVDKAVDLQLVLRGRDGRLSRGH